MLDGYNKIYRFGNNYGASVVCHDLSYGGKQGLFEVAVLDLAGEITYDTPITSDVVGHLDFVGVADILVKIQNLPKNTSV
jgi:hypothetical protein